MQRVPALEREDLGEFESYFELVERTMGFVPNSMFTMGRRPEILRGFVELAGSVLGPGQIGGELKQLVAFVASNAAGCRYCQAHTSHNAVRQGASVEKLLAAFDFATNDLFSEAERAALRLANDAAIVPNAVSGAHFEGLQKHFTPEQIVELVAVVSLFGFLNRWNDTIATTLEQPALSFASGTLSEKGWRPDKHV